MKNNEGQASLEYMVLLAISLLIFAAIIVFSMNMVNNVKSQLGVDTAYKAVEDIKEAADFIYVHGDPSKIRRSVEIPSSIENVSISNNLVKMSISTGQSYTDVYDITKGNMTADSAIAFICRGQSGTVCQGGTYILDFESLPSGYSLNISAG